MRPDERAEDRELDSDRGPDSDRASADLLIDRERLSGLLGRGVRVTRLRFKPGLSTTAVLLDTGEKPGPPGWVQASHPAHADKLGKAVQLAAERGQQVHRVQAGDLTVVHGGLDTDPRLQKGLDTIRSVHPSVAEAVGTGRLEVLRYNPHRRLVLRRNLPSGEALVLRVTAHKQAPGGLRLRDLVAAGVPVIERLQQDGPRLGGRVTAWPWFGRGDLASPAGGAGAADAGVGVAADAGAALARLHRSTVPAEQIPDPVVALDNLVADMAHLDLAAAERMRTLTSVVADRIAAGHWDSGPVHGDFSADQVLVGGPGEDPVRLTDFDRAGHGPLLLDLGSFVAAELLALGSAPTGWAGTEALPLTRALLAGYGDGERVDDRDLRTWVARALLTRVTEPFRAADADWADGIRRRLDQIEQVLS